jgi:hypothetical protein
VRNLHRRTRCAPVRTAVSMPRRDRHSPLWAHLLGGYGQEPAHLFNDGTTQSFQRARPLVQPQCACGRHHGRSWLHSCGACCCTGFGGGGHEHGAEQRGARRSAHHGHSCSACRQRSASGARADRRGLGADGCAGTRRCWWRGSAKQALRACTGVHTARTLAAPALASSPTVRRVGLRLSVVGGGAATGAAGGGRQKVTAGVCPELGEATLGVPSSRRTRASGRTVLLE